MVWYRRAVMLLSIAFVAIGIALLAVAAGERSTAGYVLGGVFVAVGVARITMERRRGASRPASSAASRERRSGSPPGGRST